MLLLTIHSEAALAIVTQPFLVGDELQQLALAASRDLVRAVGDGEYFRDAISLEILNGGRYYFAADAIAAEYGQACATSSVRAQRSQDAHTGEWSLRVWDWQALDLVRSRQGPVVVGDTISTGTTLGGVLSLVVAEMEAHRNVRDIVCITFAGSSFAAQSPKLLELDERLARHGKHIVICFANGQYELNEKNGTDLRFTGRHVLLHNQAKQYLDSRLGEYIVNMRSAVWDWSDRFLRIERHLHEVQEHHTRQRVAPAWLMHGIAERLRQHAGTQQ